MPSMVLPSQDCMAGCMFELTGKIVLEGEGFVGPIVGAEHLPSIEPSQLFSSPLAEFNQPILADGSPGFADIFAMADEKVILGRAEHLGTAGIALSGSSAEKLAIDAARAVGLGGDHVQAAQLGHASGE